MQKLVQSHSWGGGGCTLSHSTEKAVAALFREDPEHLVNMVMAMRAHGVVTKAILPKYPVKSLSLRLDVIWRHHVRDPKSHSLVLHVPGYV